MFTGIGATSLTLLIGLGSLSAQAQSSPAVPVPQHPVASTLTLLGASGQGVVVAQSPIPKDSFDTTGIFSGAEGTELIRRPEVEFSIYDYQPPKFVGVAGGTLAWGRIRPGVGSRYFYVNRMNLRTGQAVQDGLMPEPLAFTESGWLSDRIGSSAGYPFPPTALKLYRGSPGGEQFLDHTDIVPSSSALLLSADKTAAIQEVRTYTDLSQDDGAPRNSVELVDLVHKTKDLLVSLVPDTITAVALSPTTIAWTTQLAGGPVVVHLRARTGGPIASYTDPSPNADTGHLAAGQNSAGYLVNDPANTVLRIISASPGAGRSAGLDAPGSPDLPASARTVDVPDGSAGIAAVGSRYLTAVGGPAATAGVYSVNLGSPGAVIASRTATVPPRTMALSSIALTGSRLIYSDASLGGAGDALWQRSLTGNNRPTFSPESRFATSPTSISDLRRSSPISFSAGRGAVTTIHDSDWHLLDRGTETGSIPPAVNTKVSGPYVLSGGKVYDTEGGLLWSEPAPVGRSIFHDDIFGSKVVYALRPDDNAGTSEIWVDDVEHPAPLKIAETNTSTTCFDAPYVAIWGRTVAWSGCDDSGIVLTDVLTRTRRSVPGTSGRTYPLVPTLGEGVVAWPDDVGTTVVDTTVANPVPVVLPGLARKLLLDDHRIARQLFTSRGQPLGYDIQALPFKTKNPPRLIGVAGPLGFTPDGDGHADTWRPQFDLTKPLRSAELTITDLTSGKTLRSLVTTAPDGSIRGLSWDGRDKRGAVVPIGTYRWTLTGKADDGDGRLLGPQDQPSVTGTVEINAIG
jgi:hypothetical protein